MDVGPPGKDGIWDLGIHGRISNTPAEEVSCNIEWEGNELVLTVQGKMREAVFKYRLSAVIRAELPDSACNRDQGS